AFEDLTGRIHHIGDLVWRHPKSQCLDYPVTPAHEVQQTRFITADEITRENDPLGRRCVGRMQWIGTKHASRGLGISPVAGRHGRTAMNELTDFSRSARPRLFIDDEDLISWDRATNRVRMGIDLDRRQIAAAEGFRHSVLKEEVRIRQRASYPPDGIDRQ